jgi:ethanolamine transporter EutH
MAGKIVELKPAQPDPGPPAGKPGRFLVAVTTVLLLVGAILIVGASWITWRNLDDYTIFRVLIPGVVGGVVCIIIASTLWPEARKRNEQDAGHREE